MKIIMIIGLLVAMTTAGIRLAENAVDKALAHRAAMTAQIGGLK